MRKGGMSGGETASRASREEPVQKTGGLKPRGLPGDPKHQKGSLREKALQKTGSPSPVATEKKFT